MQPVDSIVIENLQIEKIEIKMVGVRADKLSHLNEAQLKLKLPEYDQKVGFVGVKNVFASSGNSVLLNIQEEQAVPEGIYMFTIRTDPLSLEYFFKSALQQEEDIRVESKERKIIFQISQHPVSEKDLNVISTIEETNEMENEPTIHNPNTIFVSGQRQATIYQPSTVPTNQYFLRQLLFYDQKFGFEGIRQILKERQKQNSETKQEKLEELSRLSNNLRIKKNIPVEQGMYIYEIFNQPRSKTKTLYFQSKLMYFVNNPTYLEQITVQGSKNRRILF